MSIRIKAVEKKQTVGTYKDQYRYQLAAERYNTLDKDKVITEAALRSGITKYVCETAYNAIAEVIKAWATEGHSVAIPGLGYMRFGVRAKTADSAEKVATDLIKVRRIVFTPSTDIKDELASTPITITCYDRNGQIVKTVNSDDGGTVDDSDSDDTSTRSDSGSGSGGSSSGSGSDSGSRSDSGSGSDSSSSDTGSGTFQG